MVRRRRLVWTLAGILAVAGAGARPSHAQRVWSGFYGRTPPKFPTADTFDGSFHFCRVMFTSDRREKQGWGTDYPGADINFSVRLAELTKVRVKMTNDGEEQVPDAVVVRLTDDALFQCPFTLMEDAGTAQLQRVEVTRLRRVPAEGRLPVGVGLSRQLAREQFDEEIGRVLPPASSRSSTSRRPTIRCGTRCSR